MAYGGPTISTTPAIVRIKRVTTPSDPVFVPAPNDLYLEAQIVGEID